MISPKLGLLISPWENQGVHLPPKLLLVVYDVVYKTTVGAFRLPHELFVFHFLRRRLIRGTSRVVMVRLTRIAFNGLAYAQPSFRISSGGPRIPHQGHPTALYT